MKAAKAAVPQCRRRQSRKEERGKKESNPKREWFLIKNVGLDDKSGVRNVSSKCFRDGRQRRTSSCLFWSRQLDGRPAPMITVGIKKKKRKKIEILLHRCHTGLKA